MSGTRLNGELGPSAVGQVDAIEPIVLEAEGIVADRYNQAVFDGIIGRVGDLAILTTRKEGSIIDSQIIADSDPFAAKTTGCSCVSGSCGSNGHAVSRRL